MKAVVQNYRTGSVTLADVPVPQCPSNGILVRTAASLVSIGTERSIIDLGRKSLVGKARARPDLFKRALEKAKREGFWKTFQESLARLDVPVPLGYSLAGTVIQSGTTAHGFSPGDRVACAGHPYAAHAEFAAVPANLACHIPSSVAEEEAAFCMLGAIAMHGVRSTQLQLGGTVAVIGLGLLGILSAQIFRAYGCQVIGMDPDQRKVQFYRGLGLGDAVADFGKLKESSVQLTRGAGCDAVVVAAATKSSEPVTTAIDLCRQRGRIVVLGVADIHPDRNEMWKKEVEIVVSKAGGPGALDPIYELDGIDLPIGIARWTQGRNVEEFLRLVAERHVDVKNLVTHRVPIADAEDLYSSLVAGTLVDVVGAVLLYQGQEPPAHSVVIKGAHRTSSAKPRLAVLGAGLFGRSVFIPVLARESRFDLVTLVTSSGISSEHSARKFGFRESSTDVDAVFERPDIDAVVTLLPHSQHAKTVLACIRAGKHLFIEKPLCVTPAELESIKAALATASTHPILVVGHNRRYSQHTKKIRSWLGDRKAPLVMTICVNAGFVPADHWVHREDEGRSRIVGEGTHFVDLACAIVGTPIRSVYAARVRGDDKTTINNDNFVATMNFADGSVTSLIYTAQGHRARPREVLEIFSEGKSVVSTDFRTSELYAGAGRSRFSTGSQNYGYEEELEVFADAISGRGDVEPALPEVMHVMRVAFAMEASLAEGVPVAI